MNKKSIVIILNSLAKGGAEKSNATISNIVSDLGYDVNIIAVNSGIDFKYSGKYYCLESRFIKNKLKRKYSKFINVLKLFSNNNFDIVIDARSRPTFYKTLFYKKIIYKNTPTISLVHSSKMRTSFPLKQWQTKYLYKKDFIVTVSKSITETVTNMYGFYKVKTIYNAVSNQELEKLVKEESEDLDYNYILFFGRFENKSKNLLFLLEAYGKSILPNRNIKLMLLGKGPDELILRNKVRDLNLKEKVVFKPFVPNPMPFVKEALFTVMTSNYEGFPMTIIESLSIGTPLVTLDFVSGPSEIIVTGKNGILVKDNEKESFTKALNKMIDDQEFYVNCKEGCKESVRKFEMSQIAKEWDKLLQEI